jgi:GST-like protein
MLEESGLAYEPHFRSLLDTNDQLSPEFRSLNPYGKIPAILIRTAPRVDSLALFESGANPHLPADKTGCSCRARPAHVIRRFSG